jgi:hypothetical protein
MTKEGRNPNDESTGLSRRLLKPGFGLLASIVIPPSWFVIALALH